MAFDTNDTRSGAGGISSEKRPSASRETPAGQQPDEDFKSLLDSYEGRTQSFSEGEVIKGRVIAISAGGVIVDVGFKSEGVIPTEQFLDEQGRCTVKEGDQIDVFLEQTEDANGHVVLSREKAERMKIWDVIERRVIKVNKKRGNIVLSRKAVLEEAMQEEKAKTMEVLEDGKVMEGVVKNITDYGAFIDLGGVDGRLHITDMSWGRVNHPSELFNVGDKIKVKVIKFNREDGRVSLGYKQLTEDPWLHADMRYPKNLRVQGKVVSLTDYGAFVELEPGIEGLIHISEMTWNKRVKHPSKIVSVNEMVDVVILDIDTDARRISLGLKQTEPNPWDVIESKYAPGTVITGKVRNVTDFGVFVEVEEGIDGLVHVSDMSWTKRIKHPSEILKKGDEVQAVILSIDAANQKLSLGIKQLEPDRWEDWFNRHNLGEVVRGKVVRMTNFGAFVELADGIEGL